MAASFFFYDVETSGFDPRRARIMQFAGQRTDMNLKPIGEPVNVLIKLTPDVLPDPDAVLITGITPQQTLSDGLSEAEFLKLFYEVVVKPETIFVGFNSIRFDDEFMRFLHYRNFYDAYEWQWQAGCSRWDLLDLARMTRALRPEGIEWPFAPDGKPSNRLEYLAQVNKLEHANAHDALSDVLATIDLARLLKTKQPDLFDFLLQHRDKKSVAQIVNAAQPFVYTTGRYPSANLHTSAAVKIVDHPQSDAALVYDLRHDPTPFLKMSVDELTTAWRWTRDLDVMRLPVKTIKFNRVPAVAPLGVIKDKATQDRIGLTVKTVEQNLKLIKANQVDFAKKILTAVDKLDTERQQTQLTIVDNQLTVDGRLYDGFIDGSDKQACRVIRAADPTELNELSDDIKDERLKSLLPLYKARNYPQILTAEERVNWEKFCWQQLFDGGDDSRLAKYFKRLEELSGTNPSGEKQYLLEELQLYGQSLIPDDVAA